jgi:hypothetical protein
MQPRPGTQRGPRVRLREHRHRASRKPGRLAFTAVAGLFAIVAIVAALFGLLLGRTGHDVARSVTLNLLTAGTLALVGYLYLFSWVRHRTTRHLLELARRSPDELFGVQGMPHPLRIVGRDRLIGQIATGLSRPFRTGPQIVVGETGSGKTSLLVGLAQHLARRGIVPIGISLRGARDPDLMGLARTRFLDEIDPHARSAAEAERVWRMLCQGGGLVILVDDLDRADFAEPGNTGPRRALEAARDHDAAIVVTSRRPAVPAEFERSAIELDALRMTDDEATAYVLERAGRPRRAGLAARVRALVEEGILRESPFYLGVMAELLADYELPSARAGEVHATRVALLAAYYEGLAAGQVFPDARIPARVRASALAGLETLATLRLVHDPEQLVCAAGVERPANEPDVVNVGERLGLTTWLEGGAFRFSHQVLHAYLASRRLRTSCELRRAVVALAADDSLVQLALVLASTEADEAAVLETVRQLLERSSEVPSDARLLSAAAAAEIAAAADLHQADAEIAKACASPRVEASLLTKLAAVRSLAALQPEASAATLWEYASDEDYDVRWEVGALWASPAGHAARRDAVTRGLRAYRALSERFEQILQNAEQIVEREQRPRDDWDPAVLPLKDLAWILPALRTSARDVGECQLERDLDRAFQRVLTLEGTLAPAGTRAITEQRGLEASIAQGLKLDALRHPLEAIDHRAEELLERAQFWYSRLNLVHALALRASNKSGEDRDRAYMMLKHRARRDAHPFVRAAARLAARAVNERLQSEGEGNRYIWDDEGVVVGGPPDKLDAEASQLVGDIAVVLNMNEASDREGRAYFGSDREPPLPVCFARSRDRGEVFGERGGCPSNCAFGLCPYRVVTGRQTAHRSFSRAFCRYQRLFARARFAHRWGSHVRAAKLRDFWAQLEQRAHV